MKPRKLSEDEIRELQEQFPKLEQNNEERLENQKKERLQNKIEMIVIVFGMIAAMGAIYLFYLVWNYRFIGVW